MARRVAERGSHTESSNLLAVLDQLNSDTLANSGVGLLGLNTDLLENDALGVGRATERRGLVSGTQGTLLEVKVRPLLVLSVEAQLAGGVKTAGLSSSHFCFKINPSVQCILNRWMFVDVVVEVDVPNLLVVADDGSQRN